MITRHLPAIALLILMCACTGGCKQDPKPPPISSETQDTYFAKPLDDDQVIGDIETMLRYHIQLSPESMADNIIYEEKVNMIDVVTGATIYIGAPQPEELWLMATVSAVDQFRGHTVLVKPRIYLSGDGIERKSIEIDDVIMGDTAARDVHVQKIDLLKLLDETPKYVLVTSKIDIYFFKNTPLEEADLENLDSFPPEMHTQRIGNYLEVYFNF